MKKIFTIVGARPQFIKAAVISRILQKKNHLQEYILHTGQHYDDNMSEIFFREMSIPEPNFKHSLSSNTHGTMTGEMLSIIEHQLLQEKPDIVLVYGDTNSTLAGALAASKLHIPVAHIEAGMRSFDKRIPEEINRIVSDHISDFLFCTTNEPQHNLIKEGISKDKTYVVGDIMYDAILYYKSQAKPTEILKSIDKPFYLATIHRQENTNDIEKLKSIIASLKGISQENPVVLPLHPRTKNLIVEHNINTSGLTILPPLGYFDMIYLLSQTICVITDSGGLQREAYYMNTPCVVVRNTTEWKELIDIGVAKLTGDDFTSIKKLVDQLLKIKNFPQNIYGDGNAGEKIVSILSEV